MSLTPEERAVIAQSVLEESGVTLRQLAEDAGLNYGTLRVWARGKRNPQPENLRQIAEGLRVRSARLTELAGKIERAGSEGE